MEDNFFTGQQWCGWFQDDSNTLPLLSTLFLLSLDQLHLSSSGTRSQSLGTPASPYSTVYSPATGAATHKREGLS